MRQRHLTGFGLVAILAVLFSLGVTARAAPLAQFTPFPTPTPLPDGRIIYIAVEGDSAWRIAAIFDFTGEKYDDLRALNRWGDSPIIKPGDEILLGYGGPAEVTPTLGPSPTPAPLLPTPSALPGKGNLCIILYNDLNGDSLRQESEPSIAAGAFSVTNRSGTYSKTTDTTGGDQHQCFEDLPEGEYNISIAIPDGYNPTTVMNYTIKLGGGEELYIDFGAQANSETLLEAPTPTGSGKSPLLGLVGILFLLLAGGLAVFAFKMIKL